MLVMISTGLASSVRNHLVLIDLQDLGGALNIEPDLQVISRDSQPAARCSRAYANAHTYHINSISMSSDQETFLSADDLRINLWHLDVSDCSFNILDIKPTSMEDLTEACPPSIA